MKNIILPLCFLLYAATSIAQQIPPKDIEDKVLGWMKVYNFNGVREPLKVDAKLYTPAQQSIADSIGNWLQASYLPKGGLGDVKRRVSEKLGLYNKNNAAIPQSYGAVANTYSQLKYNANGKMVPLTSDGIQWSIMANAPVGIPADALCTPTQYYFTLPSLKEQGYSDENPYIKSLTTHPNTIKYPAFVTRNENGMFEIALLLYPQNDFPFIKITKREYLEQITAAIERNYAIEKEEAVTKWFTDATRANARKYADERYQKRISVLNTNKERYKDRLEETAEIFTKQPDIMLENYPDVFVGNGGSTLKLPVYKINPVIAERCKIDNPQWLTIFWNGGLNSPVGINQHESITNNFNFDYLYNFCFDPEKVKGQSYKPLRSPR